MSTPTADADIDDLIARARALAALPGCDPRDPVLTTSPVAVLALADALERSDAETARHRDRATALSQELAEVRAWRAPDAHYMANLVPGPDGKLTLAPWARSDLEFTCAACGHTWTGPPATCPRCPRAGDAPGAGGIAPEVVVHRADGGDVPGAAGRARAMRLALAAALKWCPDCEGTGESVACGPDSVPSRAPCGTCRPARECLGLADTPAAGGGSHPEPGEDGLAAWPDDWPAYYNSGSEPCDAAIGPCLCGAWHMEGEFEMRESGLYRHGKPVALPAAGGEEGGQAS